MQNTLAGRIGLAGWVAAYQGSHSGAPALLGVFEPDGTALYATLPPTLPVDTLQRALTGEGQPRVVLVQDSLGARYLLAAGLAVLPDGAVALVHGQPLQAVWATRAARQRTMPQCSVGRFSRRTAPRDAPDSLTRIRPD